MLMENEHITTITHVVLDLIRCWIGAAAKSARSVSRWRGHAVAATGVGPAATATATTPSESSAWCCWCISSARAAGKAGVPGRSARR